MALMAMNNVNAIAPIFGFANVQNFANLALTLFAVNIISSLPGVQASDAGMAEKTCEVICDPIAEGKDHPAEQTCRQMCKDEKGVVRKAAEWTRDKTGNVIKGVAPVAVPAADCLFICMGSTVKDTVKTVVGIGWDVITGTPTNVRKELISIGSRSICPVFTFGNYLLCNACCATGKYFGAI